MFDKIKKSIIDLLNYFAPPIKQKHICSINFEINFDETINISCHWPNFNRSNSQHIKRIAEQYGSMLFLLNNGFIKEDIINTLVEFDNFNNEYDGKFINISLQKWLDLYEQNLQDMAHNTPLIKPSSVFKNYK